MRNVSDFVVRASRSWPLFILCAILGPATLAYGLFPLMEAFTEISGGFGPFDWQRGLDRATIDQQLPLYTEPMLNIYAAHSFIDFVYPWFMGTFFGALAAFFLRWGNPTIFSFCCDKRLFALFLVSAVFDILENFGAMGLIWGAPERADLWAGLLLFVKPIKPTLQQMIPLATLVALTIGVIGRVAQRFTR